ncbi:MAG: UDP-N-acetylmuramoyl-tripeptide--D-alanyl-D-alanine ligase [Bacteroidaceae bacterium]|nr:UDP-N-acetylmuramoyl-tripeptide--D-alanyl-D-alanine ligase [Bacteroidaceae bacterium]
MTIEELYEIFLRHPQVTTDSRRCPEGSIFFALKGENFNGNRFAEKALEQGCSYAVVDESEAADNARCILVDDVLTALQQLARMHREHFRGPVIQITGTNGKTTTKELVSTVLAQKYNVLFTQGNLNNHIGVPLTLLRLTGDHDIAVIETGANHPGEIAALSNIVKADYGLITNVGRAHLEGFGSFEGVKKTKGELYDDLQRRGASIFLNAQDDDLLSMATARGFSIGDNAIPYIDGQVVECAPFLKMQWRESDEPHTIETHLIGAYNIANIRAAITVGLKFGVTPAQIGCAIEGYVPSNSRSELRRTERNQLIVDAYNANPSSMAAALQNFALITPPEGSKKMAILGEMRELGADSEAEHRKIMDMLAKMEMEEVWLVGKNYAALNYQNTALNARYFNDVEAVKAELSNNSLTGRTILIKGSNGNKLFELPEFL